MIAWLLSPAGKAVGGLLAVAALAGGIYVKGRQDERHSFAERLASDRVTILRDGKEIDHEVFGADDAGLCALLGGC